MDGVALESGKYGNAHTGFRQTYSSMFNLISSGEGFLLINVRIVNKGMIRRVLSE
jgi:hypothetical protein